MQNALEQVPLAHRDSKNRLCIYTDVSDTAWSVMVTQVANMELSKQHFDQKQESVTFISRLFNSIQQGCAIVKKVAYAVMDTLNRMNWLAKTPDGLDLCTDHNNLLFLLDSLHRIPDLCWNLITQGPGMGKSIEHV